MTQASVTDVQREAFEKWATERDMWLLPSCNGVGTYCGQETEIAWESWQAALSTQPKAEGWRPIETAPEGVQCIVGWVDDGDECTEFDTLEEGVWQSHNDGLEHFISVAPPGSRGPREKAPYKHWMPLPPIPTSDLTAIIGEGD